MTPEKALGFMAMLLGLLAVKAGCVAMSIVLNTVAPAFTARAVNAYQTRGKWSFVLGAVNGIVLFILFLALANASIGALKFLGVLVLFAITAAAMAGYMISYHDFARHLRGDRGWTATRSILFGGILTEAAFMTPVIGQVLSIGVLFRGLGAVIGALLSRGAVRAVSGSETPVDNA